MAQPPSAPAQLRGTRQLDLVKCEKCRTDKVKCLPVPRDWPNRCDRCQEKGWDCSEGTRAKRKSRQSTKSYQQPSLRTGLSIDDAESSSNFPEWVNLVSLQAILSLAMTCFRRLETRTNTMFSRPDPGLFFGPSQKLRLTRTYCSLTTHINEKMRGPLSQDIQMHIRNIAILRARLSDCVEFTEPSAISNCQELDIEAGELGHNDPCYRYLSTLNHLRDHVRPIPYVEQCGLNIEARWKQLRRLAQNVEMSPQHSSTVHYEANIFFVPDRLTVQEMLTNEGEIDALGRTCVHRLLDMHRETGPCDGQQAENLIRSRISKLAGWLNIQDMLGRTPLHIACEYDMHELVALFLDQGAKATIPTFSGALPIHYTAATGALASCKVLLKKDPIHINQRHPTMRSPLYFAVRNGHSEVASLLLTQLNRVPHGPLPSHPEVEHCFVEAIKGGYVLMIERFIAIGVGPDVTYDGYTVLHLACQWGDVSVIRTLMEKGNVTVDHLDQRFQNSLFHAISGMHEEAVAYLLTCPAIDVNAQNIDGDTALMVATIQGSSGIVSSLLGCSRTDVSITNNRGQTALDIATKQHHQTIEWMLLNHSPHFTGISGGIFTYSSFGVCVQENICDDQLGNSSFIWAGDDPKRQYSL